MWEVALGSFLGTQRPLLSGLPITCSDAFFKGFF